jgi:hypothetical protein
MPARSKKQQMAAGAALSAKRGETSKSQLKGASKQMVDSMTEKELHELASTPRKKLPAKKSASPSKSSRASPRSGTKRSSRSK